MNERLECGKCRRLLKTGYAYFPRCGESAKKAVKAQPNGYGMRYVQACVYGPPYHVVHHCDSCNEDFVETGLGCPEMEYCPYCGKKYPEEH